MSGAPGSVTARHESTEVRANARTREGCALVTGASRGIGAATARALAADGWPVAVNYRSDADGAEAVASDIRSAGGQAISVRADVAEPDAADALLSSAAEELGPVLVLVNNAGLTADALSLRLRDDDWDRVIQTNLTAAFRLTRRALADMVRARFGRIVNVASIVGMRANPGQANYAASKAGLVAFTKTVAVEVARRGVTANAVAPGFIETELTADLPGDGKGLLDAIPARRTGTAEEVAACIRFLASEEASYVTGSVLTVDGGMTA
jgi:3-oxoacyl-[acyl-carrier protein] reductase